VRLLHVIHDFLPRHRAGSEIYALGLCQALAAQHAVVVLCAEYDPARRHGALTWRSVEGVPVVELVNNWVFSSFEETYRSAALSTPLEHVLRAVQPDVLHVHNLLNLSFELPELARRRGIPAVATLHDFTLVCPSGGQRVHLGERHVCVDIDAARCARCFAESPFHRQMAFARVAGHSPAFGPAAAVGRALLRRIPAATRRVERALGQTAGPVVSPAQIEARLAAARRLFEEIDLFVAPSAALAEDFVRLGMPREKLEVSDYGFSELPPTKRRGAGDLLRIGFVGTLAWHKGVHLLLEASRQLPEGRYEVKVFGDIGTFPDYAASLRDQARGLPVRFMGAFDHARAAEVYEEIDVLVVPSLWPENSPLVIHEAFMAGVPVVGARQGGIPGLVTHGDNGLLYDAFSAADLAATLRALIGDPGLVARLAARAPAVKSVADDAREWVRRYERLCSAARGAPAAIEGPECSSRF
jgi:glycosyltransferase involved in cell wall biosynthesis